MPKSKKTKYYAVCIGRGGPQIYDSWDMCRDRVSRYPGAIHKSFTSKKQAEDWLASSVASNAANVPPSIRRPKITNTTSRSQKTPLPAVDHTANLNDLEATVAAIPSCDTSLSPEQSSILKRVKEGRSVFFTGSAGTGKSVLLREIIHVLGGCASRTLGITASTGIASVNIGGTTLHSWAAIGLGQESEKNLVGKFIGQVKYRSVLERWRHVRTLIIDEISMIDGGLFDKLEYIARHLRRNDSPFGGIQLVLSGDFCQLPPVPRRTENGIQIQTTFAFEAQTWNACVGRPASLTRVFRQRDQAFADMLNAMRFGKLDAKTIEVFRSLSRKVIYTDGIEPTELFSTRKEVDNANLTRLRQLKTEPHTYQAKEYAGIDSSGTGISQLQMERLLERLVVPKSIQLKVGSQVMLIKNLIQGELVNGSVGQIVRFCTSAEALKDRITIAGAEGSEGRPQMVPPADFSWPVVRFIGGRETMCIPQEFTINNADGGMEARRDQIPLILAWALSVHKSQGQTLERVMVDLKRTFEKGQAYVALSRATCMEQLQVLNFDPTKVVAHPRVLAWYNDEIEPNDDIYYDSDEMNDAAAMATYYDT